MIRRIVVAWIAAIMMCLVGMPGIASAQPPVVPAPIAVEQVLAGFGEQLGIVPSVAQPAELSVEAPPRPVIASLGDSYASGIGGDESPPLLMDWRQYAAGTYNFDAQNGNRCFRNINNDGARVAAALGAEHRDVTCTSATPLDLYEYPQFANGGQGVQTDVLQGDEDVVFVDGGGNPAFGPVVYYGILFRKVEGVPVMDENDDMWRAAYDYYANYVPGYMTNAINAIKSRTDAEVYLTNYPPILQDRGSRGVSCWFGISLTPAELAPLQKLLDTLNNSVRQAAEATGSVLVDLTAPSSPWVTNPNTGLCESGTGMTDLKISVNNLALVTEPTRGQIIDSITAGSFHMNSWGLQMTADAKLMALRARSPELFN